jgi:C-terminal processing protease CtpA/Prc
MREYVKKGRVHVLTNNATMSQGEIFLLQLMRLPQVRSLGQTTKGTLMYGNNYGRREKLPSQAFEVYITDLRSRKRLMRYEVFGVDPDILLGVDRDWIEQAIALIRHN